MGVLAVLPFTDARVDNVCIESLSIDLTRPMLDSAARSVTRLAEKIDEQVDIELSQLFSHCRSSRIKKTDASKLQDEYRKLVEGLQEAGDEQDEDGFVANPGESGGVGSMLSHRSRGLYLSVLPDDLLTEAVPGNIRHAEHFVAFLKRFVEYVKVRCIIYANLRGG